ncbi:MAG TPA: phosphatidylglycerol lysyltransferase domain-containing protein, partial [Rhodopila sp.]
VGTTSTIFFALLPHAPGLTWLIYLGVYVASYTAGLAANLPGGIGVFDTAMLFGLEPYMSAPHIVGAILIFRLYYYVIPLFLAGSLFAGNEILLRGGGLLRHVGRLPPVQAIGRWSEPDFAVTATTGAVGLCGVLMLCLGVLAPQADFSWIDPDYGAIASQAGQFVPSLIGAGLVLMAVGLSQRVNLAWGLTILLLVMGAAFAATQDNRLWVSGILILTTLLLAPFRACFYRHAHLLSGPLQPGSAVTLALLGFCLFSLAMTRPHTHLLKNNAFWAVIMSRELPNTVRLAVAIAVLLGLTAMWLLLRPGRVRYLPWDGNAQQLLRDWGGGTEQSADGVVLGESARSAIPFRRCGRVLLGLGDPVGDEADRVSAIWRLRDLAQQEGLDAAVWHAGPELLKVYGDLGLTALPLGSDGLPLPESDGDTPSAAQYLVCVAERDLNLLLPVLPSLAKGLRAGVPAPV